MNELKFETGRGIFYMTFQSLDTASVHLHFNLDFARR